MFAYYYTVFDKEFKFGPIFRALGRGKRRIQRPAYAILDEEREGCP
jgi:hypothetical protein